MSAGAVYTFGSANRYTFRVCIPTLLLCVGLYKYDATTFPSVPRTAGRGRAARLSKVAGDQPLNDVAGTCASTHRDTFLSFSLPELFSRCLLALCLSPCLLLKIRLSPRHLCAHQRCCNCPSEDAPPSKVELGLPRDLVSSPLGCCCAAWTHSLCWLFDASDERGNTRTYSFAALANDASRANLLL